MRAVADNLSVLSAQAYSPYGEPLMPAIPSGFGFTGEQTDPSNALVYLRARHLNPRLGIFPSLDPLEGENNVVSSLNRYNWVRGNVVNRIDASGKSPVSLDYFSPGDWGTGYAGHPMNNGGGSGSAKLSSGPDWCSMGASELEAVGLVDAGIDTGKKSLGDSFQIPNWIENVGKVTGIVGKISDMRDIGCMLSNKDFSGFVLKLIEIAVTESNPAISILLAVVDWAIDPSKATLPSYATITLENCSLARASGSRFVLPEEKLANFYQESCYDCRYPGYHAVKDGLTNIIRMYGCDGPNCIPYNLENITVTQLDSLATSIAPNLRGGWSESETRGFAAFLIMTNALRFNNSINTEVFQLYMTSMGYNPRRSFDSIVTDLTPSITETTSDGRTVVRPQWQVISDCNDLTLSPDP